MAARAKAAESILSRIKVHKSVIHGSMQEIRAQMELEAVGQRPLEAMRLYRMLKGYNKFVVNGNNMQQLSYSLLTEARNRERRALAALRNEAQSKANRAFGVEHEIPGLEDLRQKNSRHTGYYDETLPEKSVEDDKRDPLLEALDEIITDSRNGSSSAHPGTWQMALLSYASMGDIDRALELWNWLHQRAHDPRFRITQGVYGAAMEILSRSGKATSESLQQLYKEALNLPSTNNNKEHTGTRMSLLLQGYIPALFRVGDIKRAKEIWNFYKTDMRIDLFKSRTISNIMSAAIDMGEFEFPQTLLSKALEKRAPPTSGTFASYLRLWGRQDNFLNDFSLNMPLFANVLQKYEAVGGKLIAPHFNVVLDILARWYHTKVSSTNENISFPSKIEQLETYTIQIMNAMKDYNVPYDIYTATYLVRIAGQTFKVEILDEVLNQSRHLKMNSYLARAILRAHHDIASHNTDILSPETILKDWRRILEVNGADGPNNADFATLALACRDAKESPGAETLFNALIKGLSLNEQECAKNIFIDMMSQPWRMNRENQQQTIHNELWH